jgi:hypothetical protein
LRLRSHKNSLTGYPSLFAGLSRGSQQGQVCLISCYLPRLSLSLGTGNSSSGE